MERFKQKLAIGIAISAAAVWLWINYCRFPNYPWNDVRLIPAFMAAAGEPVYNLPGHGILNTWMYGPIPLWLAWPVTFAPDAVSAFLTAGAINLGFTLLAIAMTCFYWPGSGRPLVRAGCDHRDLAGPGLSFSPSR